MGAEDYRDGWVSASCVKRSKSLPRGHRGQSERGKERFFAITVAGLAVRDNKGASGIRGPSTAPDHPLRA